MTEITDVYVMNGLINVGCIRNKPRKDFLGVFEINSVQKEDQQVINWEDPEESSNVKLLDKKELIFPFLTVLISIRK